MAEFDWALANMAVDSKGARTARNAIEKEALEAEAKQRTLEDVNINSIL